MTHQYAENLVETMEAVANIDFATTTAFIFLGRLRLQLIEILNGDARAAEAVANSLEVQLPVDSLTPEQIDRLATATAQCIKKAHDGFERQGFDDPLAAVIQVAKRMHLKLS